ncbi:unnamed protein product, partial [Nesidiocoris tenuis]
YFITKIAVVPCKCRSGPDGTTPRTAAARSGGLRGTPGTAGLCPTETTARTLCRTLHSAWRTLRARVNLLSTESQETFPCRGNRLGPSGGTWKPGYTAHPVLGRFLGLHLHARTVIIAAIE